MSGEIYLHASTTTRLQIILPKRADGGNGPTLSRIYRQRHPVARHVGGLSAANSRLEGRQSETRLDAVNWIYGLCLFRGRQGSN